MSGVAGLNEVVADLASALDQERLALSSMLELAIREQLAIVGGDVALLTQLTNEKEHLLELVAALETERMTAITAIAAATGQDAAQMTLSTVIAALPVEQARALTSAGVELRREANALREANERNAQLLRTSRDIVDRWLHYLRSLVSNVLYDASGRAAETGRRTRVDRSA
jgi:flagellar biosynthesis/type III secretory pathway chaperone